MRRPALSVSSIKPVLAAALVSCLLCSCQVAGGGRFDSNQALAFVAIGFVIFLLVILVVQRNRFTRLLDTEVKKAEAKAREDADRRIEKAQSDAEKETKRKVERAVKQARAELQDQIKSAKEDAQLEAVKLVRETKTTAKAELEIKLNEVRDQALAEAERRIQEVQAQTRADLDQRISAAEQRAREDALSEYRRQRQDTDRRSREDAERRLQEARRRAAQARNQRSARQSPATPTPAPRPTPPPQRRPTPPVAQQQPPRPPQQQQQRPSPPVPQQAPVKPAATPAMTMPWSTGPNELNLPAAGISILLAEDSATIRKVFEMVLAGENCKLVTANTGDQAVDLARKLRPDLVIADLSLDQPDGYEICKQLKANVETSNAKVILLHGSASVLDERKAQQSGAQGEITKPFTTAELLSKIQSLF